jgi:hypothetical protein
MTPGLVRTAPEDWILYTWQTEDYVSLNQARIPIADENTGVYQIQYLTNRSGFYNIDVYMVPILSDGTMSAQCPPITTASTCIAVAPPAPPACPLSARGSFFLLFRLFFFLPILVERREGEAVFQQRT